MLLDPRTPPMVRLPYGIAIYRGLPASRGRAKEIVQAIEACLTNGDDLRRHTLEEIETAFDEQRCLMALTEDEKLAGFVFFTIYADREDGKKPFLCNSSLLVLPEYRHHGLGQAMKQILRQIEDALYGDWDVLSLTTNLRVIYLNQKGGFREIGLRELWEVYGLDMLEECRYRPNLAIQRVGKEYSADRFEGVAILNKRTGYPETNMALVR